MARPVSSECQKCGNWKPKGECKRCRRKRQQVYRYSEKGMKAMREAAARYRMKKRSTQPATA